MTTISPTTSDQPISIGEEDPWSTRPLSVIAPPDKVLYAVSDRDVTRGAARPTYSLLAAMLIAFAVLNLGDLASTYMGLMHGLNEGNPLMYQLLARFGFGALIADKLVVVVVVSWGALLLRKLSSRIAYAIALVCDALILVVVVSNIVQFATIR